MKKAKFKTGLVGVLIMALLMGIVYGYVYLVYQIQLSSGAEAPHVIFEEGANSDTIFSTVTLGANGTSAVLAYNWVPCFRIVYYDHLKIVSQETAGGNTWYIGFRVTESTGDGDDWSFVNLLMFRFRDGTPDGSVITEWTIVSGGGVDTTWTGWILTLSPESTIYVEVLAQLNEGTPATWTADMTIEMVQNYQSSTAPTPPAS